MVAKNPKLMIIDYYDSLIQQVDIHTEEQLSKYTENSVVGEIEKHSYEIYQFMKILPFFHSDNSDLYDTDNDQLEYLHSQAEFDFEISGANINKLAFSDPYAKLANYTYLEGKHEPPLLSTNVHQFLNKMRDELLGELKRGQEEALKHYDKIKNEIKVDKLDEEIDRNRSSRLFENEYMFLILDGKSEHQKGCLPFKMYLIVLDFYVDKKFLK